MPYQPLTDEELEKIRRFKPGDLRELRAYLIVLLMLDGLLFHDFLEASIYDINLELGFIVVKGEAFPLSSHTVDVLRQWLEVRPQKGTETSLITAIYHWIGRRVTSKDPILKELIALGNKVIGRRLNKWILNEVYRRNRHAKH